MPPNSPGSDSAADSVVALLAEYRRKGIKLWADHGKLKFKAPDGALTPELKQNLRRHKQAILAFFEEVAQSDTGEIIPRRRETRPTPLSFGQQGLWFLNKLRPGENISTTLLMEGPLDVGALEQALDAVTRQHDILRTSFQERDGVPLQVIASRIKPDVDLTDLQDITHTEAETDILVNRLSFTRFQLDRAPLLKLHLLRLNPREHLMMVVMHHIISDGWSISVLMDGIRKVYTAIIENRVARLPDLPLQYADYAAWQRGYLTGELLEEKLLWWREYLAGAPEMTTLLTDRTRRLTQDTRGRIIERIIPGIQPAVAALSRETGSTVFIVLLSAFYATLYRVLGQDDLTVGTPLAGRRKAELEPMIGYFINMLVLRGNVSGNPTFAELLDRVCARTLEAYDHQEVPFDQVVDAVSPNRSNSFTPLFQISFGVQNMPPTVAALPALSMSAVPREQVNTPFDINFMIHEEGSDLKLVVEYNSALFLKPTLDLFCQRFTALVRGAVDRPRTPVDRLPVMDAEERLRLIEAWNLTDVNYPDELSLGDLTARQAQRSPEAPAVIYGSYPLTYGRLNRRANQLVHYIAEFITEPGQPVGLLLEPGIDLAVAILAVVKAGAAYVPMDPDNPAERLSHMITDTGMRLLLSHSSMENALPEPFSYVAVSVDNPRIGDLPDTEPHIPVDGRMTAYIMYTSGSTGKPKGTVIPHRAVTRLVWQSNFLQIGPQTRMGQIASVVFDAFTLELWGPLLNGGTMVGADRETRLDAGRFAAWLRDEGITDLFITVALFNRMVSERPDIFATIQTLMSGGEAPDHHAIRTCLTHGAPKRFLNVYGPTENTTFSTWRLIELLSPENAWIPMGEPITNSTAYVLDHLLEPVGLGMPGELCLGGDGLADGYLNRPALTAEKFVPHPFSREPGERLYRSGDLVTIKENAGRPDFIFLNRLDSQVKLRGLRIELGEIEAALENIDGVVQAAVLLRREDDKRLVAYLVATDVMDLETIKTALRRSLPDYMIPAVFVPMDALPITANGKLDRRALPAPNPADTIETSDYIAPKTPTQESLATCWAELLGLPRVSISANFFDLGGHSLLATRVLSFIRANFKTELSLEFFFANPTVEAVADQIDNQGDRTTEDSAVHPVPRDAGDLPQQAQPLSFSQQRLWFLDRLAESGPARIGYNMPALLLLQGHLDTAALESSLTQLTAAHESLRTTFSESNGKPRQVIHKPAPFPLPLIDLTGLGNDAEAFSRDLAVKTARQQFDLERGPLFKAALVRLGERRHLLLLCQHHIISDGWSVTLMVRETARRYRALTKGEFLELPFRAVQYADFAAWQRSPQRAEVLAGELTYWKQNLSGAPTLPALPADRFRPAVQTNRGAALAYRSGPQLQEAVNRLARDCDVTPFMVLEAAFALLLQMYSGQDDLCVGTPVANRNRAELEPILGFFVNTLVIRNDLAGVDSFRDLLTRTKSIALGAFAHQDVPFELIVETLQPERSRAHSPLFQVMFALQNQPDAVIHMPGLSMEPITVPHTTTMFDLTLSIFQTVEGMRGRLEYSTDLFDESTIARLAGHYTALLEAVTARPDSLPSAGQLADEAEKRALLNAGQAPEHSRPVPIHHTLARLAETTPEAPAMAAAEDPQDRVDYRTLQALVEALARRLHAAGIGSERVVALAMNRSTAALVAQLAVWRAGGAVVCLELTLPEQRVRNILTDSGAVLILAEQATADQVMTLGPPVLLFGDVFARARDIQLPEVEADSRLAYLIYTSGTTGTPKGVAVSRTALASHCAAMVQRYELTDKDIILQFAAFGFDASLEQWLPGLSVGARIVTRGRHLWSVESLLTQLANHRITVANLPPALWTELLTMLPVELPHLRMLILGGEALPVHGLKPWFSTMGGRVRLLNAYGPTETVITATTHLVPAGHDFARVPIGDALPGRRVYVLDERGALTPFGIPGQLAIGGHLMARGYLKLPARTAGVFVPDPFSTRPGARLYLTGDRVRRLQDHSLDFLGRVDRQVKLRGFRIEPGEIEAVLVSSPLVARAAVLLHTGLPGGDILAAYVIPGEEPDDNFSTRLHAHLAQKLPPYMIPASFQTLETIPMTPGGKVDRRALRQMVGKPDPAHRIQVSYTAPSSRLEATLAEIWEDILSVERVGIHDNFFELGGHSLLATRVISGIHHALHIELPLSEIFETPTVAGLALKIAPLFETESDVPALEPLNRDSSGLPMEAPPLSFAQQRLWFLNQLAARGDTAARTGYNMFAPLRLRGPLDSRALEAALNLVIQRHETLRTTFNEDNGEARQQVHAPAEQALPVVDLTDRHDALPELVEAETRRLFDLARGPLFVARLLRLAVDDHVLLLNQHHIVSDGWSISILIREITAAYAGNPLPPLSIQYTDFAAWQRSRLKDEALQQHLAFWKENLASAPPLLALPIDLPRPAMQSFDGAVHPLRLEPELTPAVNKLARQHEATPFMVLQAAFAALLSFYSGQEDVTIGTPVANRSRKETEPLIGFFVNTLAMRNDLSGCPSFADLLHRVRRFALAAYTHQDVPFELVVEALQPERSLSHAPLFQVMFSLQNLPVQKAELPGLSLEGIEAPHTTANHDLTLNLNESAGGLTGHFEYCTALFRADTIARMAGDFENLLRVVMTDADRRLTPSILPVDPGLLYKLNQPITGDDLYGTPVHRLAAGRAATRPDLPAFIDTDNGEAIARADMAGMMGGLAARLRDVGMGPEKTTALILNRSPRALIAHLAVWEAGGIVVFIDPAWPSDRIQYVLNNSDAVAVVAETNTLASVPDTGLRLLMLDDVIQAAPPLGRIPVHPHNTAYLIYTSGTTGRPKGVAVGHGALAAHCRAVAERYSLTSNDTVLQFADLGFDASLEQWLPALTSTNGRIAVRGKQPWGTEDLLSQLQRHRISVANLPPALWRELVEAMPEETNLPDLRLMILGGDTLPAAMLSQWWEKTSGKIELLNAYGPTETVITATTHKVTDDELPARIPIGRRFPNRGIYVLDAIGKPVPPGFPGQLALGGNLLARGYWSGSRQTAEVFVPDPYAEAKGARLYLTGDRVRLLPDHTLDYLGRLDRQVKLRGFRIELGEIEAVLVGSPLVARAAVLLHTGLPGGDRLAAYVIPGEEPDDTFSTRLHTHLAQKLPPYMIPASFQTLETIPLTPGGKVDRRALRQMAGRPDPAHRTPERYTAPSSRLEATLAEIWEDILSVERVGIHDNFFELGGHSLLATRVISGIRHALHVELPLADLFEAPTVAGLALKITPLLETESDIPALKPLSRDSSGLPLEAPPLSFAQQRLWFLNQLAARGDTAARTGYNMFAPLRLRGPLDSRALEAALNLVIQRHETLRTTFSDDSGEARQVIQAPAEQALPVVDLAERNDDLLDLVEAETRRIFDLARGPLFAARLLRLAVDDHVLLLNQHHIVSDGWSISILIREITAAYAGNPLPPLSIQYADFAAWQRSWLKDEALQERMAFWKEHLAGAPPLLALPTDLPRPAVQSFDGAVHPLVPTPELTPAVNELARQHEVTPFMVLQAAFAALLSFYSGQDDVMIGTPVANRNRKETEPLIGFFVNTLVMRNDLSGRPSFADLLHRVRHFAPAAYTHQDVPFELVVEALQPERSLSHPPLFQVMFSLQNLPAQKAELPGLSLEGIEAPHTTANHDLTLNLNEGADGLTGYFEYSTALFRADTIARMAGDFENLLCVVTADAGRRLTPSILPVDPGLLARLNQPAIGDDPDGSPVHHLAARRAATRPDLPAFIDTESGEMIVRGDMAGLMGGLAARLCDVGVGPEKTTALILNRSPRALIAHLAVWEAGGIVVFIDPAWPSDRIEYVLNDSDAVAVLAETDTLSSVPDTGRRLLMLDDAIQDAPPLGNIPLHPHNTAYLIYTSGTTGRPKGVAVSHGALAAHCHVVAERYSLTSNDTVMQFADLGFDASLEQWLPALAKTNGRVAVRGNKPWSTEDLLSKLQQYHISVANLPPALWRELVEAMPEETDLPDLRLMILGGDTLPAAMLPQWWQKTSGKIELLNAYGPTETVITATTQSVAQGVLPARIPIGRQLPNRSIYVLDAFGKPVPPGFPGQLALGGNLLAGGYWGRPGQTAEVFVPDPYAEAKGARLYLTGDRVRLLPDYSLDYLGRLDRQIKLRGFRIELGEIEAALNQSPLISRSAVFVRKDSLTACLTLGEQARGDLETDLKNHLQRKLPAYMIPASFVVLKNIPLTAGGKIDRRALEALAAEAEMRRRSRENFRPPASHWEQTIAETWREVLSLERVGVDDNFFELGGHSLLLVKLHRLLRERLQTDLELVDLMANPTVAAQARLVAPPSLTETKPKIDHGARRRDAAKKKKDQWKKRRSRR